MKNNLMKRNNMEKLFVNWNIACYMKRLGFKEKCVGYLPLNPKGKIIISEEPPKEEGYLPVATWEQAFDFFRTHYGLYGYIHPGREGNTGDTYYAIESDNGGKFASLVGGNVGMFYEDTLPHIIYDIVAIINAKKSLKTLLKNSGDGSLENINANYNCVMDNKNCKGL